MKLSEIYRVIEGLAPKAISDEYCKTYGAYDNSGLLVEADEEITGVLFSLDLTNAAIDEAIEKGCNLIHTHHPVIYGKIDHICTSDEGLLGGKLVRCLRHGISLVSTHLNLDMAKGGIDESLMEGICKTTGAGMRSPTIMQPVGESGYGRVYDVAPLTLDELTAGIKKEFSTERVAVYGDGKKTVARVASFCGAGGDERAVAFAKRNGADVIVSADFKHHVITYAVETGLSVIALTHYASENYGFEKYYEKIRRQIEVPCVFHTDRELL